MENKMDVLEPLLDRVQDYTKTSFELYKLRVVGKSAKVVSTLVSHGLVIITLSLFMVFINIGLAIWLGDLLGKLYLGFFCIAGFYVLLAIILYYFMQGYIKRKVSNVIISEILN